jgi:hypothetical protein
MNPRVLPFAPAEAFLDALAEDIDPIWRVAVVDQDAACFVDL